MASRLSVTKPLLDLIMNDDLLSIEHLPTNFIKTELEY